MGLAQFPTHQSFDFEALRGRLLSSSYTPESSSPNCQPMLAELEFSNLMFKLGNFGHFLRLFGTHYREIARLKPTTRLS